MIRNHLVLMAVVVLAALSVWAGAQGATISAAPELHGVVLQAGDGPAIVVQAAATSLTIEEAAIPEVPEGTQAGEDVEEGTYNRVQWDKGAFLTDRFSARWTGTVKVDAEAEYTFYVTTDDGARLVVDGETIVDVWVPRPPSTSDAKATLTAGDHEVVLTYFEGGGGATARLEWSAEGFERQIIPADKVTHDGQAGWQVEWFDNTELEGEPVGIETSETIDFAWDMSGPKIGEEEPGTVAFDWTRVSPAAIVGRINAGPETKLGIIATPAGAADGAAVTFDRHDADLLVAEFAGQEFGVWLKDPGQDYDARPADGAYWCPPTEGSVVFVAGFLPFENMTAADCRAKLKEAYLASVSPDLPTGEPDAEGYIALLNGEDLEGWSPRGRSTDGWEIGAEGLEKAGHGGSDIFTNSTHLSCDLHVEFKVPERSNSGVYLQGRYEIQVLDSYEGALYPGACGGIYNTHAPSENASKPPGEWQSFDIDFTAATVDDDGRVVPARMTIKHNDVLIHDDREVPRATGGEMNRNYLQPGPVLLQGTHGPVTYRNIKLRPK